MKRIQVTLTEDQVEGLERVANTQGIKASEVVRNILFGHLAFDVWRNNHAIDRTREEERGSSKASGTCTSPRGRNPASEAGKHGTPETPRARDGHKDGNSGGGLVTPIAG